MGHTKLIKGHRSSAIERVTLALDTKKWGITLIHRPLFGFSVMFLCSYVLFYIVLFYSGINSFLKTYPSKLGPNSSADNQNEMNH